jgi:hypothetical protein
MIKTDKKMRREMKLMIIIFIMTIMTEDAGFLVRLFRFLFGLLMMLQRLRSVVVTLILSFAVLHECLNILASLVSQDVQNFLFIPSTRMLLDSFLPLLIIMHVCSFRKEGISCTKCG